MRDRRALPALFAVLVLVIGQLSALAHAAATRHIRCSEHGEELETARLADALHDCDDTHLVGVSGASGEHADCPIARTLHASAAPTSPVIALAVVESATATVAAPVAADVDGHAVYRLAPKTSPPALS